MVSANTTCKRLVPEGGTPSPAQIQALIAQMVKNAECMRSHGVTNFPDPTVNVPGMLAGFSLKGLDPIRPSSKPPRRPARDLHRWERADERGSLRGRCVPCNTAPLVIGRR